MKPSPCLRPKMDMKECSAPLTRRIKQLPSLLLRLTVLLSAIMCLPSASRAADRAWAGGDHGDGRWSNPNNWNPAGVPQDGEDLEFADAGFSGNVNMHNDLAGLRTGYIQILGSNWTLDGNDLTLGDAV